MKSYMVDVDITMSKRFYIEASSDEEARRFVDERLKENPYGETEHFDAYVCHEIVDVNEDNNNINSNS